MLIVSGNQTLLEEIVGGIGSIQDVLKEGVDLGDEAIAKLEKAIARQAETSRQVKALALREMGPVGELLARQIGRLQVRAVELVEAGALDRAMDELREGLLLVATLLAEAPTDIRLRLHLGFVHKALAQVFEAAGDEEQATAQIGLAEEIFRFVREEVSGDEKTALDVANAIHGLGNVDHQRGDYRAAIAKYELAVSIYPGQVYSWHDMFGAYHELAKRGGTDIAAMFRSYENVKRCEAAATRIGGQQVARLERILAQLEGPQKARTAPSRAATLPTSSAGLAVTPTLLTIAVAERQLDAAIINLNCRIDNPGAASWRLQRLEAQVTAPDGTTLDLPWTVFYDFDAAKLFAGARMTKTCDAREINVAGGETLSLGIQFASSVAFPERLWTPGDYACTLRGWTKAEAEVGFPAILTRFKMTIGASDTDQIHGWRRAAEAQWEQLNDPDHAIGIPVRIHALPSN